jgi:hypothetical protein
MTVFVYATYRAARRLMNEQELSKATELARQADAGDSDAGNVLRSMLREIVSDRKRVEQARARAAAD